MLIRCCIPRTRKPRALERVRRRFVASGIDQHSVHSLAPGFRTKYRALRYRE